MLYSKKKFFLIKLNRETYEAPNLIRVLSNSSTQFVMHYARQDLLWLKYHLNVEPKNIFCTKLSPLFINNLEQLIHTQLNILGIILIK